MNTKFILFSCLLAVMSSVCLAQNSSSTELPVSVNTTALAPINTTTEAPTTSPAPVNTTTEAPTTTPAAANTTTPAAANTTSEAPATTSTPVTTPAPTDFTYDVKENNVTCLKMTAQIEMAITYEKKAQDGSATNETVTVSIPKEHTFDGACGNTTESLTVTFFNMWMLTFTFSQDDKSNSASYRVGEVTLKYNLDADHFPGAVKAGQNMTVSVKPAKDFLKSSNDGYYVCNADSSLEMQEVKLTTSDLKYRAFNTKGDIDFKSGTVSECSADEDTNSIVPIAVGAALAGLVVVVLIAYLIGRKRSRKTGYESV